MRHCAVVAGSGCSQEGAGSPTAAGLQFERTLCCWQGQPAWGLETLCTEGEGLSRLPQDAGRGLRGALALENVLQN